MADEPTGHPETLADESTPPATSAPSRRGGWLRRAYRLGRGLLAAAMLCQLALVFTPLSEWLYLRLAVTQPAVEADVIICLGGRTDRIFWAAQLYHWGYAPLVVVSNVDDAAKHMRDRMLMCGVPADRILTDVRSRSTGDHPAEIAGLPGIDPATQRFLIVTNHAHSRRAAACFRKGGYQHFTVYGGAPPLTHWNPSLRWRWRVKIMPYLAYEYAALLNYWCRGRI